MYLISKQKNKEKCKSITKILDRSIQTNCYVEGSRNASLFATCIGNGVLSIQETLSFHRI